ncbi:right-handed parallel beta-helix repeat-containing protein [Propionicimonas sp.]|uniref:right-handed parallel beta-helix repeat-containing protein n=1 Tax=Propionicimonas sp. TaxID=1955623 RepID=UPI002F40301A
MKRLASWILPAVLLTSVALAEPAHAAEPPVSCGSTLTVDTTLRADLYCSSGDGLTLAPNVHLDLGGHKLVGSGSGTGIASVSGNISIRNGVVKNWETGISLAIDSSQTDPVQDPRVTDVVLRKAPLYIGFGSTLRVTRVTAVDSPLRGELGGNLRISRSTFTRSSIGVFEASASIRRSTLIASTLNTSGSGGITVDRSKLDGKRTTRLGYVSETGIDITNSTVKNYRYAMSGYYGGATLTNSTFTDMQEGVLAQMNSGLGSEGTAYVRGNTFTRSGVVLDPHIPMVIENNTFVYNTAGAIFTGSTLPDAEIWAPGRAVNNVLKRNKGTGITSELAGLEVGGNTATRNGGYGINAPGAVDLGGNTAYGNKLGQCVGVVCSPRA